MFDKLVKWLSRPSTIILLLGTLVIPFALLFIFRDNLSYTVIFIVLALFYISLFWGNSEWHKEEGDINLFTGKFIDDKEKEREDE